MIVVMNDDRVSDVAAYLPLAKAFAADAMEHDKGCLSMEILVDPNVEGRVVYLSHFASKEDYEAHAQGTTFQKHVIGMGKYFLSAQDTIFELY